MPNDALLKLSDMVPAATPLNLATPEAPAEVDETELVSATDYASRRKRYFDKLAAAAADLKPAENDKYILRVANVTWADTKAPTMKERQDAINQGRNITRRLVGTYELLDKATGKVINKSGRKTLMNVPVLTDGGTFVRNGVEVCFPNQLRLASSVFVRKTADGYPEAQINLKPGTGPNMNIYMEPSTSVFYMTVQGRKIPAYPVFKEIGMTDEQIKSAWGDQIWQKNATQRPSAHLNKWLTDTAAKSYKFLLRNVEPPKEPASDAIDQSE